MAHTIKRILVGMVLSFLMLFAAPGDLDITFGSSGKVVMDYNGLNASAMSVALQSDGKIVVAGNVEGGHFALSRFNTNGTLDTTFGSGGIVTTDIDGACRSLVLQSDGKIVVAGYTGITGYTDFILVRFNTNGTLDTTFGIGGKVTTDFNGLVDNGYSVDIQSDGKIVVAGTTNASVGSYNYNFALARYNTNGTLDTTFGNGGKVSTDFNGLLDLVYSVVVQSDGKIVAAGYTEVTGESYNFALARYNANGTLDTTFAIGGKVTTDIYNVSFDIGRSVALQSDGKILVAGVASEVGNRNFALVRYDANGTLDSTFGNGGKVTTDFNGDDDDGWSVALQNNGKIVVSGEAWVPVGPSDFGLTRYNADGTLDTTFSSDGKVTTDFGNEDVGLSVAIQSDGKIVVAGISSDSGKIALARYEGDPTVVPEIDVSPLNLYYSDVIIGNTKELNVTVSNIGTAELIISGISILGANETEFSQTHNCAAVVVQSSCTIDVTFIPLTAGTKVATLSIDSDDADEATVYVTLTANAKTPQEFADDIVAFIDFSVESGDLQGTGGGKSALKRIDALKNMILKAKELIVYGDITAACEQLTDAYEKTDGEKKPPDLVKGSAVEELAAMIQELQQSLGC